MLTKEELVRKYLTASTVKYLTDDQVIDCYITSEEMYNAIGEKLIKLKGASRNPYASERKKLRNFQNKLYPELASRHLVSFVQRKLGFNKQVLYNRFRRSNI